MSSIEVEVVEPDALGAAETAAWATFRAASPQLASPYFDLRYVRAAAALAPHGAVAVIHRHGAICGFLPFQRRGTLLQPLGAPLSDYHGLVAAPNAAIPLAEVLDHLKAQRLRFSSLVGAPPAHSTPLFAMAADLSGGFAGWEAARQAAGRGGFLKDKRRRMRQFEREVGPVRFSLGKAQPAMLDQIIALKRAQIRRTGQHDIFACGWTIRLLHRLAETAEPDFGLQIATLHAGDQLAAAEIGLRGGHTHHLWFPVFDPQLARYSPGSLMTIETLRAAAGQGVRQVDFGPGFEAYKNDFATPSHVVHDGVVGARLVSPDLRQRHAAVARFERRIDRIAACEPQWPGRLQGASVFAADIARRRPGVSLGLGGLGAAIGLGVSLSLLNEG